MQDTCGQCGHANGPHILAATIFCTLEYPEGAKEIPAGGHRYCPVPGCECRGTWSIPDDVAGFDVKERLRAEGPPPPEVVRKVRGH